MEKGTKHSLESIEKMRISHKRNPTRYWLGKHHSEETKEKISKAHKGQIAWCKGKRLSSQHIRNLSLSHKGYKWTEEQRKKILASKIGKKLPFEWRKNMSIARRGSKCWNWKGGISPINRAIRQSLKLRLWREAIFKRDNWTCIWCKTRTEKGKQIILHPDHIKPFAYFPIVKMDRKTYYNSNYSPICTSS